MTLYRVSGMVMMLCTALCLPLASCPVNVMLSVNTVTRCNGGYRAYLDNSMYVSVTGVMNCTLAVTTMHMGRVRSKSSL